MSKSFSLLLTAIGLTLGCGQSPPMGKTAQPKDAKSAAGTAETRPESLEQPAAAPAMVSNEHAVYLSDDVVGLAVAYPRRFTDWPAYKQVKEAGMLRNFYERSQIAIMPEEIELATIVVDSSLIFSAALAAGLNIPESSANPSQIAAVKQKQAAKIQKDNLKQVALAFLNYESAFRKFPRADADGDGRHVGLSWRVHLLPFLEENRLYEQFHLDESWDSEHNKTLIPRMPDLFKSSRVTEPGKTSIHVFTGEGAPFHGDKGANTFQIKDGTSNTFLAVLAGADTADVWTKPGGLAVDPNAPKKALGTIPETSFLAAMCDGSVLEVSTDVADQNLLNLIQMDDGRIISDFSLPPSGRGQVPAPTVILSLAQPADRDRIIKGVLGNSQDETFEGVTLQTDREVAVWFPDDKTLVIGPIDSVKQRIREKKTGAATGNKLLAKLEPGADLAIAVNSEPYAELMEQLAKRAPMVPVIPLLPQVKSFSASLNPTGKPGTKLVQMVATTTDDKSAGMLSDLLKGFLAFGKQSLGTSVPQGRDDDEKKLRELLLKTAQSASLTQAATRLDFTVTIPDGYDQLSDLMKGPLEKALAAERAARRMNSLRELALAFHNYESAYRKFPGAGRAAEGPVGLSWRVHLLPFVDQAPLYFEFKLDEPWDSEHNKKLVARMPDLFKTEGVTESGKTSLHVFSGAGAPFADDQAPSLASITDGLSNTILIVEAGPETAVEWTKPGGLDFDPKDPLKALGTMTDDFIRVVMFDGVSKILPKSIKPETLRRLIESRDGERVDR